MKTHRHIRIKVTVPEYKRLMENTKKHKGEEETKLEFFKRKLLED